jgi:outer membrane lipopolysaccharide assembly protein LptE/RlpB
MYINTIVNNTDQPGIEIELFNEIIEEVSKDSIINFTKNMIDSNAILNITIKEYNIKPLIFYKEESQRIYEIKITIDVLIIDRYNNIIFKKPNIEIIRFFNDNTDMIYPINEEHERISILKNMSKNIIKYVNDSF